MGFRLGKGSWRRAALVVGVGLPCVLYLGMREAASSQPRVLFESQSFMSGAVFSPTEPLLACIVWDGFDKTVQVWDSRKQTLLWKQQCGRGIGEVVFSADGRMLASSDARQGITLFDTHTGTRLRTLYDKRMDDFDWFEFAPDGKTVLTTGVAGQVWSCNVATGHCRRLLAPPTDYELLGMRALKGLPATGTVRSVGALVFSPDTKTIVGNIEVRGHQKGMPPYTLEVSDEEYWFCDAKGLPRTQLAGVTRLAGFSPDSRWLAVCRYTATAAELRVWNLKTKKFGQTLQSLPAIDTNKAMNVGFSRDGNWIFASIIASNSSGQQHYHTHAVIWDVNSGRVVRSFEVETGALNKVTLSLSADNSVMAVTKTTTGLENNRIRLWRLQ